MKKFLTLRTPVWLIILAIVVTLGFVGMKAGALITDYWDIGPWRVDSSGHFLPGTTGSYNIGSSSLKVANLTMNGDLAVGGAQTLTGDLTVNGYTTLSDSATITGTLAISGATTASGDVTVSGYTTMSDSATITGTLAVSGAATLSGAATVSGYTTLSDSVTVTGTSAVSGSSTVGGDLTVTGKVTATEALIEDYEAISSTYSFTLTADQAGYILVTSGWEDITVTLPNAETNAGIMFYIKVTDTGTTTIDGGASGLIDGSATYTGMDAANDCIAVKAAGLEGAATNWWIFNRYIQ